MSGSGLSEKKSREEYKSGIALALDFSKSYNPIYSRVEMKGRSNLEPDPNEQQEKAANIISSWVGVRPSNIMVFNSLTAIIHSFYRSVGKGRVLMLEPLFPEHHRAAIQSRMKITSLNLNAVIQDLTVLKNFHPDIISMNSPVNPTGETLKMEQIELLLEEAESIGSLVFVDEAFVDYYEGGIPLNYQKLLSSHNNFICGRTLSKISGKKDIKMGFAIAPTSMVKQMEAYSYMLAEEFNSRDSLPFEVDLKWVSVEREFIRKGMEAMELEILGNPTANFISFRTGSHERGEILQLELERKGIIIRDISNYYRFSHGDFRICIRDHHDNEILLGAMMQILKNEM